MCGIAGMVSAETGDLERIAGRMADQLAHRGPDDSGVWCDAATGVALAHRRLSIIDLSAAGHQPMHSASGRYVLSYNGEIYNFQALRAQLDYPWQGHSDTEVILAAIEQWGIEKALQSFNGMFALALWDTQSRQLTLARDRIGEKPLYYGWHQGAFLFASELKAMQAVPGFSPAINRQALLNYTRYSYIAAPDSIYEGIHKLEPGCYLTLTPGQREAKPIRYWSLDDQMAAAMQNRLIAPEAESIDQLEAVLGQAVKQRIIADVPLGAFLSGGIDSTAITLLMQQHSAQPVKTYSIGFQESGFDEAPYAKAIARHIGTDHTELYVSATQAREVIPQLPQLYDEPFADSSQIPTYLVAQMTQKHVTVALSGDAGDELFGGYNRYRHAPRLWQMIRRVPASLRPLLARVISHIPLHSPQHRQKLALAMQAEGPEAFYRSLCSIWQQPEAVVKGAQEPAISLQCDMAYDEWMMQQDMHSYLPGDILTKVDRAAMGVSLETRIPFLDPAVMEFAWRLPREMKIRDGKGKWILRQMLYRHLPESLIERPKAGFAIPLGDWLRGPLRDWAEDLLQESHLAQQGYYHPQPIRRMWQAHLNGHGHWEAPLWNILIFQSWLAAR